MDSDNDLTSASAPLMIYSALAGVCAFCMLVVSSIFFAAEPEHPLLLIIFVPPALISLILGILAWGIRNERRWAWIPATTFAAAFAMVFPIGTIISYYALRALWRCRASFFPFTTNQPEQGAAEQPATRSGSH